MKSYKQRTQFPFGIESGLVHRLPPGLFLGLEERIRDLHRLRLMRRLQDFVFYITLWLGGVGIILWQMSHQPVNLLWWCVGSLLAALGLNGFVLLVHDGMHGVLFKNSGINRLVSVLLSYSHLMSFTAYQVLHIRHHKNVGVEGDPDHYANYVECKPLVWILNGLRLLVAAFLYLLAIPVLACWHGNASVRRHIAQEYLGMLVLAAPIVFWVPGDVLLWTWFVPMVIVALITQLRAFAQHTLTDPTDPLLAARSMRPWRLVSFVMLHENYHLEHHLFPRVPSYNLPCLSRTLEPRLPKVVIGSSYLALIFRYLRASLTLNETPVVVRENATCSPHSAADNTRLA